MKLSAQICTKEQSIKLRTLGIIQHSLFRHDNEGNIFSNGMDAALITFQGSVAAFTVAELMTILPVELEGYFSGYLIGKQEYADGGNYYTIIYTCVPGGANRKNIYLYEDTCAQSLGAILIHLLETGKVTAAECNTRLMQA